MIGIQLLEETGTMALPGAAELFWP
nr:unnamed protein product [Callosobruchus analis]